MSAVPSPADRLALSRQRLRQALSGTTAAVDPDAPPHTPSGVAAWWDDLKHMPGVAIAIEALHSWWAKHPLHAASLVAANTALAVVRPLARRHPLGCVLGAFLLGGLLAWSRPWRWALKPALFAGLLQQLVLTSLTQAQRKPAPPPPPPPTPPSS